MARVLVTNIPLNLYVCGYVEVPDDTADDDMQEAVAKSLIESGYRRTRPDDNHVEIDEGIVIGGWEFTIEEVHRGS